MNKRQRKKRAKKLGLPFEEKPRARRRRPEATRPAEAPGRPPVRPSRRRRAALEAAASAASQAKRADRRKKGSAATASGARDPTVTAAPSLTEAAVGLAKASGELAGEVVRQTLTAAEEAIESVVDKVPLVGAPVARELHHLTHEEEDDEPASRTEDEEPLA
jgi:hypothetical protein